MNTTERQEVIAAIETHRAFRGLDEAILGSASDGELETLLAACSARPEPRSCATPDDTSFGPPDPYAPGLRALAAANAPRVEDRAVAALAQRWRTEGTRDAIAMRAALDAAAGGRPRLTAAEQAADLARYAPPDPYRLKEGR